MVKQNINLYLASPRGFCAGVDRAVKIVEQAIKKYGSPIYVRHEIVHNKDVVKSLESLGAIFVDEITDAPENSTIIFSAHGVPKSVFVNAKKRKMLSIDATCPLVTKVHNETIKHFNSSRKILLIGHKNHPEVIGTLGQLPKGSIDLIESIEDVENYENPKLNIAYVTQTTLSVDDTKDIINEIKSHFKNVLEPKKNDICYATTNRQEAVKKIAKNCDYFLVIGASNSSNSLRLVEVAKNYGSKKAILVEDVDSLNLNIFENLNNIGITASASSPEVLVIRLLEKLKNNFDVKINESQYKHEDVYFKVPQQLKN